MKRLNLAVALVAAALLALTGIAVAKDRHGDHNGRHDHHGHHGRHHDFPVGEAGKISSFDTATGKLTIALNGGESVTGFVTEATRIKCEGVDDRLVRRDHGGDDNGGAGSEPGDDNRGRGEPEPGDDNGGQAEPGDDNGGEASAGEASCSAASLTAGEIVGSAELRLEGGRAVFEEIELGSHS